MTTTTMGSLGAGYRAVIIGASGGIGAALLDAVARDPGCAAVLGLHRGSAPPLELTDEASIEAAARHAAATLGDAELIIDATGVLQPGGHPPEKRLSALDPGVMAEAFAVNAIGPALLLKHFGPLLPARGKGVFATLSARVGSIGDNRRGGWLSYRASKAALNQVLRTAAIELGVRHRGAVCVALQPGTVATRLSEPFRRGGDAGVLAPEEAAGRLLDVLDGLDSTANGGFYDHRGEPVPW